MFLAYSDPKSPRKKHPMKKDNFLPVIFPIFSILLTHVLKTANAEDQVNFLQSDCSNNGHFDNGSTYQSNLFSLLSDLPSNAGNNKFYNLTAGESTSRVYGLFLCNSAYTNQVCQDCITLAAGEIRRRCPSSKEAIVWYIECMLRYSNAPIFSIEDDFPFHDLHPDSSIYSRYNEQLSSTMIALIDKVDSGNSSLAYATGVVYLTTYITLSSYVDCTPDLTSQDCNICLQTAIGRLDINGHPSGAFLQPSCRLMYAFADSQIYPQVRTLYIALATTAAAAAASLVFNIYIYLYKRKAKGKITGLDEIESMESLRFEFNAMKAATDNFSTVNILGKGGFGIVYMGTLADGQAVAVKRLSNTSGQGIKEFKAEACLAAKLQHKNLVKLFGFCLEADEKLLVYEFLPNKSLDRFLFDTKRGVHLQWETRYKIIVGIARGLIYLHEDSRLKIIHRDLKPSNILLDGEMNPKIADFGMAKLFGADQTQGNTSRVAGTFGYMAPEYATTGHFSTKSDIFSYGVILLEIVSGKRNNCLDPEQDENLLSHAWRLWSGGVALKLVDSALSGDLSTSEVIRCIHVGLLCTQEDPAKRPTIASVLLMLNSQPFTLPSPTAPPVVPYRRFELGISKGSHSVYTQELITEMSAR